MNCQNCKHWVFNKCTITGSYITADKLCNGWELSVSFDQVQKSNSDPENDTELRDTIVKLKGFINQLVEVGNDVALVAADILEFDGKSGEFLPIAAKWHDLVRDYKQG